jgi:hypothetical protein
MRLLGLRTRQTQSLYVAKNEEVNSLLKWKILGQNHKVKGQICKGYYKVSQKTVLLRFLVKIFSKIKAKIQIFFGKIKFLSKNRIFGQAQLFLTEILKR